MSLDIEKALSDGLDRLLTRPGALLVGAFIGLGVVSVVVGQSFARLGFEFLLEEFGQQLAETGQLEQMRRNVGSFPFAVSVSPVVLAMVFVVSAFVAEAISVVGVRAFAASDPDRLPADLTDRLGLATVNGFLGGLLASVAILIGFVVGLLGLVVGSFVVAAFLWISLLFVRQEVALADENAIGALTESWELARGNRWQLLVVVVVLVLVSVGVSVVTSAVGFLGPAVRTVIGMGLGSVAGVYGIAVTTRAYEQLRGERDAASDDWDDGVDADAF